MDKSKILKLIELIREQAETSYNAERALSFAEMALIARSCDELERELSEGSK